MAGQLLARPLAVYVASHLFKSLSNRKPGKGNPYRNSKRDEFIKAATRYLQGAGFNPTRRKSLHETDAPDSACSIVKKILAKHGINIAESTVETVWTKTVPK